VWRYLFDSARDRKPPVAGTAEEIADALDPSLWKRLSAGAGIKGARLRDWVYCELADLDGCTAEARSISSKPA